MVKGSDERKLPKESFDFAVSEFKKELSSFFKDLKADVADCKKSSKLIESDVDKKISSLEINNNSLHKKLNRSDIIVSGVPDCLNNLADTVINLAAFYDVQIESKDIQQVCYINKKKRFL